MPLPTIPLKRKVRTDALAQMQDTGAINQAATPEAPKAPTLGRPYRPAPIAGKVQGAIPAAPQAPQRMAFGGQPQPQAPMAPRTDVLAGLAGGLKDARPPMPTTNAPGNVNVKVETPPMVDVNTAPPTPPVQTADEQRDALDQQIRDFVSGRVAGANDVDTTEQEALIRDLVEGKTGAALVDQRARGGRAGFAASGAQQAIEGDIRKQAGQAASGDILDLRRTEQQRAFDNATQAINTESGMRSAASDDALRRMYLEALQAEAGLDSPTGGPTTIMPADENGDGTVSVQEQQRHQQSTVNPQLEGRQKSQEFFANGGDASALPVQAVGGDVIMLSPPKVDVDGNERPGVTYNTKTKTLGRAA